MHCYLETCGVDKTDGGCDQKSSGGGGFDKSDHGHEPPEREERTSVHQEPQGADVYQQDRTTDEVMESDPNYCFCSKLVD